MKKIKIGQGAFVLGFILIIFGALIRMMWISYIGAFVLIAGLVIDRLFKI